MVTIQTHVFSRSVLTAARSRWAWVNLFCGVFGLRSIFFAFGFSERVARALLFSTAALQWGEVSAILCISMWVTCHRTQTQHTRDISDSEAIHKVCSKHTSMLVCCTQDTRMSTPTGTHMCHRERDTHVRHR